MALCTVVKVSSVNNLSDARFCAGMGVDLMGFCLDKNHPDFLSPIKFQEITGWLSGVKMVGEISSANLEELRENSHNYKLSYYQISDSSLIETISELGKPIIFKTKFDDIEQLPIHPSIHYYLLEGDKEELDKEELKGLKEFSKKHSVLLGHGFTKKTIKEILVNTHIQGIELRGGREISPGLNDFDGLAEILELLEIEEG